MAKAANGDTNAKRAEKWFTGLLQHRGHDLPAEIASQILPWVGEYAEWSRGTGPKPRGLFVIGPIGSGKTTLCEDLVLFMRHLQRERVVIHRARRMAEDYSHFPDYLAWLRRIDNAEVMIDDVGSESPAARYGVTWSLTDYFDDRYIAWREHGLITLATTNLLGIDELAERYGERAVSRLQEMTDLVIYAQKDRRQKWQF